MTCVYDVASVSRLVGDGSGNQWCGDRADAGERPTQASGAERDILRQFLAEGRPFIGARSGCQLGLGVSPASPRAWAAANHAVGNSDRVSVCGAWAYSSVTTARKRQPRSDRALRSSSNNETDVHVKCTSIHGSLDAASRGLGREGAAPLAQEDRYQES